MNGQTIIVIIIVGISAFLSIRGLVRKFFPKKTDCTSCKGCPAAEACTSHEKGTL